MECVKDVICKKGMSCSISSFSSSSLSGIKDGNTSCLNSPFQAFELLTTYHDAVERDVHFNISCGAHNGKGILLRPKVNGYPEDVAITIEPHFLHEHEDTESEYTSSPYS